MQRCAQKKDLHAKSYAVTRMDRYLLQSIYRAVFSAMHREQRRFSDDANLPISRTRRSGLNDLLSNTSGS